MAEVENITVLKKGTKAVQGQTAEQPENGGSTFPRVQRIGTGWKTSQKMMVCYASKANFK